MQGLVSESLQTQPIAQVAEQISRLHGSGDEQIARQVFWWVKNHIRLQEDEQTLLQDLGYKDLGNGKELLFSPVYLVMQPQGQAVGDCDDFSTLAATLLIRLGIPRANVFFVTVAADGNFPEDFTHVFVRVRLMSGQLMTMDCSHGAYPGWQTRNIYKEVMWNA